ncbi:MAG: hypothetical protein SGARI_000614 [Bacillariaceae sp.]
MSSYHHNGQHDHRQQQGSKRRQRANGSSRLTIRKNNPFDILGIPRDSSADTVKRKFLQLALRHHPDTSTDQKSNPDTFVKIREAFEQIKDDLVKRGVDGEDMTSWLSEEEFDAWFYEETGQKMDAAMRREVMHVYRSGLTRTEYGAVWEIAFVLEEQGFFTPKETTLAAKNKDSSKPGDGDHKSSDDTRKRDDTNTRSRRRRNF